MFTKHFGEIDVDENNIILFEEGILGFSQYKQYLLIRDDKFDDSDGDSTFLWLQSVEDGNLAFVLMDVCSVLPDYNPVINKVDIESLGEYNPTEFLVYNVVVIPENIMELSVNLKAPIVISLKEHKGKQVIVTNDEYGVRFCIFEELKKKKGR